MYSVVFKYVNNENIEATVNEECEFLLNHCDSKAVLLVYGESLAPQKILMFSRTKPEIGLLVQVGKDNMGTLSSSLALSVTLN